MYIKNTFKNIINTNMIEDKLNHIDKTKKYWYAYAESHYTLDNFNTTSTSSTTTTTTTTTNTTTNNNNINSENLNHIDKTKKNWHAYAESHYSPIKKISKD